MSADLKARQLYDDWYGENRGLAESCYGPWEAWQAALRSQEPAVLCAEEDCPFSSEHTVAPASAEHPDRRVAQRRVALADGSDLVELQPCARPASAAPPFPSGLNRRLIVDRRTTSTAPVGLPEEPQRFRLAYSAGTNRHRGSAVMVIDGRESIDANCWITAKDFDALRTAAAEQIGALRDRLASATECQSHFQSMLIDAESRAESLQRELVEADSAAKRWYEAALPYATPEALRGGLAELRARGEGLSALIRVQQFLRNGIALGYIRMPDADCPDPAKDVPGIVDAAIAALQPAARGGGND